MDLRMETKPIGFDEFNDLIDSTEFLDDLDYRIYERFYCLEGNKENETG